MTHFTNQINQIITKLDSSLPHFPDGRIDYSNTNEAIAVNCFVVYNHKLLILKRSAKVSHYQGYWHVPAGYFDEDVPIKHKALEELDEELSIKSAQIKQFKIGELYSFTDKKLGITWHVIPTQAILNSKPEIKIDWEHTEYKWIDPDDWDKYHTLPGVKEAYQSLIK